LDLWRKWSWRKWILVELTVTNLPAFWKSCDEPLVTKNPVMNRPDTFSEHKLYFVNCVSKQDNASFFSESSCSLASSSLRMSNFCYSRITSCITVVESLLPQTFEKGRKTASQL
jgi:hypothetical protein